VLVFGDKSKRVRRLVVGTGAITFLPSMYDLKANAILATDDGMNSWNGGLWSADLGVPVLVVNHATAEKPGMQAMAGYLGKVFPGTPVEYVDVELPYSTIT
jgi:aminopeptidase C